MINTIPPKERIHLADMLGKMVNDCTADGLKDYLEIFFDRGKILHVSHFYDKDHKELPFKVL